MNKTPLFTRFARFSALLLWVFGLIWRLRGLNGADLSEREDFLRREANKVLRILNVRVESDGGACPKNGSLGRLIAANHISWLDIMAVCTLYPSSFIAMQEIRSWPLIGKIVANAGTVFINRNSRKDTGPINEAIAATLAQGGSVCFFPEARTTLGNNIVPLKAALFQAAFISGAPVQALALRYYDQAGQRTESVSFADCNLIQSAWRIASQPEITVRITQAPPILPQTLPPEADRFAVKDRVEEFLQSEVLADSPNPERVLPEGRTQNDR